MRLKTRVVTLLLLCCLLIASTIFYFIAFFDDQPTTRRPSSSLIIVPFTEIRIKNSSDLIQNLKKQIESKLLNLKFEDKSQEFDCLVKQLKQELIPIGTLNQSEWQLATSWITARHVIPDKCPLLGHVLRALRETRIIVADVCRKGTQLKLMLTLESGQMVIFKPKRYARDFITDGIYSGFDRHNAEIIGFHLSRLLGFRSAPIVTSRLLDINKDIKSVATPQLLSTFTKNNCFYGQCYYCNEMDTVCGDPVVEGAAVLLLPQKYHLQKLRNPWQRTYRSGIQAIWETDSDFCGQVLRKLSLRPRVLDLIDASIFDFLIGNADRHHYEVFKDVANSALLLIDNGKGFGDPYNHELTILFPLYQCCCLRNSTYQRLVVLSSGKLSEAIESILSQDILWPLLTAPHLEALNKRLKTIMALIEVCFEAKGRQLVLK